MALSRRGVLLLGGGAAAGAVAWVATRRRGLPAPAATPVATTAAEGWTTFGRGEVEENAGRLRFRCSTLGVDTSEITVLGARHTRKLPAERPLRVSAELDWNGQANGSHLASAIVLAKTDADGPPLDAPDWLKVEYIGVPPGRNARLAVSARVAGRERVLFTEGWPEIRREGRPIGVQKLEIALRGRRFNVVENGHLLYESDEAPDLAGASLYLLMTSHANYPARELFWDKVAVE